jgi:chromate transporter
MQCGATALIVDVGINLLVKQIQRKLALPIAIIAATFIGTVVFDLNMMYLIILDGLIGFLVLRDHKYD